MTVTDSRKLMAVLLTPRFGGNRSSILQSQRDCVLQPRVGELASLPWVGGRAHPNPERVPTRTLIGVCEHSNTSVLLSPVIE
jgi:hypothetical protein